MTDETKRRLQKESKDRGQCWGCGSQGNGGQFTHLEWCPIR
jgi:hypothetical protein